MIHYINFPKIPSSIIDKLPRDISSYKKDVDFSPYNYVWSRSYTTELEAWCAENICNTARLGIQLITGNLQIHKDMGTTSKFIYLIETGGDNVITSFYDDNKMLTTSYVIKPLSWHIFKADSYHDVKNVEISRISISVRLY